jgi:hypothetical protein
MRLWGVGEGYTGDMFQYVIDPYRLFGRAFNISCAEFISNINPLWTFVRELEMWTKSVRLTSSWVHGFRHILLSSSIVLALSLRSFLHPTRTIGSSEQ